MLQVQASRGPEHARGIIDALPHDEHARVQGQRLGKGLVDGLGIGDKPAGPVVGQTVVVEFRLVGVCLDA